MRTERREQKQGIIESKEEKILKVMVTCVKNKKCFSKAVPRNNPPMKYYLKKDPVVN